MLRTRAKAADEKRNNQSDDTTAQPGKNIAKTGQRRAEGKHGGSTKTFGEKARGNLKAGKRAGEHCFHEPKRGKAETEFGLPDRQHHIDEIGIAVVQRMRAAGDPERAAFIVLGARGRGGNGHLFTGRRSTKVVLTKDITSSPC